MARMVQLRDNQWERIQNHLPGKATDFGVTAKDNRLFRAYPVSCQAYYM